jgi:flagellar basal-body rod modification protein FlgD
MTSTPPIGSASANAGSAANGASSSLNISPTQFLKLITAQMKDQNPLSPSDPTQFLSQLEGLSQVSSLQSMQSSLQSSQMLTGTSMLGHSVLASGSTATLASGGTVNGAIAAPGGASSLTVSIADSNGAVVKTLSFPPAASGLTSFTWDGTDSSGRPAPAGHYTLAASAAVNGSTQTLMPMVQSMVDSVTVDPATNTLALNTNNGTVALSSVVSIR